MLASLLVALLASHGVYGEIPPSDALAEAIRHQFPPTHRQFAWIDGTYTGTPNSPFHGEMMIETQDDLLASDECLVYLPSHGRTSISLPCRHLNPAEGQAVVLPRKCHAWRMEDGRMMEEFSLPAHSLVHVLAFDEYDAEKASVLSYRSLDSVNVFTDCLLPEGITTKDVYGAIQEPPVVRPATVHSVTRPLTYGSPSSPSRRSKSIAQVIEKPKDKQLPIVQISPIVQPSSSQVGSHPLAASKQRKTVPHSNLHSLQASAGPIKEKKNKFNPALSWFRFRNSSKNKERQIIQDETEQLIMSLVDPGLRSVHIEVTDLPSDSEWVLETSESAKSIDLDDRIDNGLLRMDLHEYEMAVYNFSVAANQGDPAGTLMYAYCLLYGLGIEPEPEKAVDIFKNVAISSHYKMIMEPTQAPAHSPETLNRMQKTILRKGQTSNSPDSKNSNENKMIAALCFHQLALVYFNGLGVVKSKQLAIDYLRASAFLDRPEAQLELGFYHFNGAHGLIKDRRDAARWLRKARDNGLELPPSSHWIDKEKYL